MSDVEDTEVKIDVLVEEPISEEVFSFNNDLLEDETSRQYKVIYKPNSKQSFVSYTCSGKDMEGAWEGERRFSEFYKLHQVLEQRWPGVPIP